MAQAELVVAYDPIEREKYERRDVSSIFHRDGFPLERWRGTYKYGRFPEIAVRASLQALGFKVLISDPEMPNEGGFILTHYAGKRRQRHPAFLRMFNWFPEARIHELNRVCDATKIEAYGNRGGSDPDLFVYGDSGDRFFVEVKDRDTLTRTQRVTFPKIAEILGCDVLLARVIPVAGAKPGDGLRVVPRPANTALRPTRRG